jgi:endoglucanase
MLKQDGIFLKVECFLVIEYFKIFFMRKLPLLLLLLLLQATAYSSDIKEVITLSSKVLLVHFDDGYAVHHQLGQSRNNESIVDNPLNISNASSTASYTLLSTDDVFYTTARNPDSIGRKTKPTEFTLPNYYPQAKDYVQEHWIFLFLPKALESGKTYILTTGSLAANGNSFAFTFNETTARSEAVHVNMIGYSALAAKKYGYLYYWLGDKGSMNLQSFAGKPFQLVSSSTGQGVFTDTVRFRNDSANVESYQCDNGPNCNYLGATVFECNFSSFNIPGEYKLVVPGIGCSFPFEIKSDVYRQVYKKVAKGLYQQRSGIPLNTPYVNTPRPRPHHPLLTPGFKNKLRYTKWRVYDGSNTDADLNDTTAVYNLAKGPLDVWGWYQDAGDWDSYFSHAKVPMMLLNTFEMAPDNFAISELNMEESSNQLPDFLDEARWQIRFYHRLRKALIDSGYGTGGVGGGRVLPDFSGGDDPNNIAIGSWQDTARVWWVSGEEPWMTYKYAGLAAQFAFILRKYCFVDPEGINWEQEAIAAYQWAKNNTRAGDESAKFDDSYFLRNDRAYAAAALYRLTSQQQYHTQAIADLAWLPDNEALHYPNGDKQWGVFMYAMAGVEPGITTDSSTFARCRGSIISTTDFFLRYFNERSTRWRGNLWDPMVNGNQTTPKLFEPMMGTALGKKLGVPQVVLDEYREKLYLSADYFLGMNSLNTVWVTGLGERSPNQDVFQLDGWYNGTGTMTDGLIPYGTQRAFSSSFPSFNALSPDYPYSCSNGCKIYPENIAGWPGHERWFTQRWAPNTCEYTIWQTAAPALSLYAFLSDSIRRADCAIVLAGEKVILTGTLAGNNAAAELTWSVTPQAEIIRFELQRSVDGNNYYTVNRQAYNGAANFRYTDNDIAGLWQPVLYRVKYSTLQGTVQYSNIIVIKRNETGSIKVTPQPASNQIQVTVPGNRLSTAVITFYDMAGKQVLQHRQPLQQGNNYFTIYTASLQPGIYTMAVRSLQDGSTVHQQKIIIAR